MVSLWVSYAPLIYFSTRSHLDSVTPTLSSSGCLPFLQYLHTYLPCLPYLPYGIYRMVPSPTDSPNFVESHMVSMYGKFVSVISTSHILLYAFLSRLCYSYTAQQRLLTIRTILTYLLTILTIFTLLTILNIWDMPHDAFSYGFTQFRRIPYGKYVW